MVAVTLEHSLPLLTQSHTLAHTHPDSLRYPHARGTGTANQGTCQHNLLPWQRGRSRRGPFPTLLLSPYLHLSGHKRGWRAGGDGDEDKSGRRNALRYLLNSSILLFHFLFASSFHYCLLFLLLSRKRMPSQEGRGEGSL